MLKKLLFILPVFALVISCSSQAKIQKEKPLTLILSDDFDKGLDTSRWISEIAPLPDSKVYTKNGKLFLDTKGGVTVWLNKKLTGDIRIEFTRTVLMDTGKNDRLSDLNVFWMATDPRNLNLFTRNGVFEAYDSLDLYYVGMGGNSNKTTRFRKYHSNGEKPILQEFNDKEHLLEANKEYKIAITVKDNTTSFEVNGKTFFSYKDSSILKEGFFGFRSTKSRQTIDDFKVYRIE
jgi:hypothetical protein